MAISQRINCDNCGVEKDETNHWFAVDMIDRKILSIEPLDVSDPSGYHACGEECANKMVGRYFAGKPICGRHMADLTEEA